MRDINKFLYNEYKKTISIPKLKNKRQIIIAPVGLVGSGKSTVIKPLSKLLSLVRISTDEIRMLARDSHAAEKYDLVSVFREVMTYYLNRGYSLAIDADVSNIEHRELIEFEAIKKDIKIFYIKISPPKKWILEKFAKFKYKKNGLFKNKEEALDNFKNSVKLKWPLVDLDYIYKFDTSKQNLKQQILNCEGLIKKEMFE